MADPAMGASTAPNGRPPNDTVAETGGGIPDDAVAAGELAPGEIGEGADAAVAELQRNGWTQGAAPREPRDPREATEGQPS